MKWSKAYSKVKYTDEQTRVANYCSITGTSIKHVSNDYFIYTKNLNCRSTLFNEDEQYYYHHGYNKNFQRKLETLQRGGKSKIVVLQRGYTPLLDSLHKKHDQAVRLPPLTEAQYHSQLPLNMRPINRSNMPGVFTSRNASIPSLTPTSPGGGTSSNVHEHFNKNAKLFQDYSDGEGLDADFMLQTFFNASGEFCSNAPFDVMAFYTEKGSVHRKNGLKYDVDTITYTFPLLTGWGATSYHEENAAVLSADNSCMIVKLPQRKGNRSAIMSKSITQLDTFERAKQYGNVENLKRSFRSVRRTFAEAGQDTFSLCVKFPDGVKAMEQLLGNGEIGNPKQLSAELVKSESTHDSDFGEETIHDIQYSWQFILAVDDTLKRVDPMKKKKYDMERLQSEMDRMNFEGNESESESELSDNSLVSLPDTKFPLRAHNARAPRVSSQVTSSQASVASPMSVSTAAASILSKVRKLSPLSLGKGTRKFFSSSEYCFDDKLKDLLMPGGHIEKISRSVIHHQERQEEIESLFHVDRVDPDGNCLFGMAEKATEVPKEVLRGRACDYILENQEHFLEFMTASSFSTKEKKLALFEHVGDMRKNGVWGGSFELFALAQLLQCDIRVWTCVGPPQTIPYLGNGTKEELIDCRLKNSHYDYLIPKRFPSGNIVQQSSRNSDDSASYPSVGNKVVPIPRERAQIVHQGDQLGHELVLQQEPDHAQLDEQREEEELKVLREQLDRKKRTKSEQRGATRVRELRGLQQEWYGNITDASDGSVSTRLRNKKKR